MSGARLKFDNPIEDAISKIRFAPQSNNLLISSWDSNLRLYDIERCMLRSEVGSEAAILDCCFQNESVAFTASSDCSITRYDLDTETDYTVGCHDDLATHVEFSDETCQVLTAGWDKKVKLWDMRSRKAFECLNSIPVEVDSLSLSGFILMVAAGTSGYMYDLRKFNKPICTKDACMGTQITCVRLNLNSEGFVVGSVDGHVAVKSFSVSSSNSDGYVFRCHPKEKKGRTYCAMVNDIALNPSIVGAFVTGDKEGYVIMWDARSKKRLLEFPRHPNGIASLSYNHSGHCLAVASSYTYQEANEIVETPQIFIHKVDDWNTKSQFAGSSK